MFLVDLKTSLTSTMKYYFNHCYFFTLLHCYIVTVQCYIVTVFLFISLKHENESQGSHSQLERRELFCYFLDKIIFNNS